MRGWFHKKTSVKVLFDLVLVWGAGQVQGGSQASLAWGVFGETTRVFGWLYS